MALGLNASDTPELYKEKVGKDKVATELPVESVTGTGPDRTAFLHIDLKVHPNGAGGKVLPMTVVSLRSDLSKLSGDVDVILWFHGDRLKLLEQKRHRELRPRRKVDPVLLWASYLVSSASSS